MRLGDYFLDFEHDAANRTTRAYLYETQPLGDPVAEVEVCCYYKDSFSRKGGRRAALSKLLDPEHGPYQGSEFQPFRTMIWNAYWEIMPQDLRE